MVTQLLEHERIQTTLPKAKELRKVADRVVTYAKKVRACATTACSCTGQRFMSLNLKTQLQH
jgi:ribosomal protein L17